MPADDYTRQLSQSGDAAIATDRLESLKAGIIATVGASLPAILGPTIPLWLRSNGQVDLTSTLHTLRKLPTLVFGIGLENLIHLWLLPITITLVSAFLFGVTFRYAVGHSTNSHLKGGVIAAFGLVRGLALLEQSIVTAPISILLWQLGISMFTFAIAGFVLDWAMQKGWVNSI